jgi:hypothetical protein
MSCNTNSGAGAAIFHSCGSFKFPPKKIRETQTQLSLLGAEPAGWPGAPANGFFSEEVVHPRSGTTGKWNTTSEALANSVRTKWNRHGPSYAVLGFAFSACAATT